MSPIDSEILSKIGLDENQYQVYLAIYSMGSATTIGQASLLTGLDLLKVSKVLDDLINLGFVKKVEGLMPRYIALHSHLLAHVEFDRGFRYEMLNLRFQIEKDLEGGLQDTLASLKEFSEKYTSQFTEAIEHFYESVLEQKQTLEKEMTATFGVLDDLLTETKQQYSNVFGQIIRNYFLEENAPLLTLRNHIISELADHVKVHGEKLLESKQEIEDINEKYTHCLNAFTEKFNKMISQNIASNEARILSLIEELRRHYNEAVIKTTDFAQALKEFNDKTAALKDKVILENESFKHDAKKNLIEIVDAATVTLTEELVNMLQEAVEHCRSTTAALKEEIMTSVSKFQSGEIEKSMANYVQKLEDRFSHIITSSKEKLQGVSQLITKTISDATKQLETSLNAAITTLDADIANFLKEREAHYKGKISNTKQKINEKIEASVYLVEETEKVLNKIVDDSKFIKLPGYQKTFTIQSTTNAINYARDMILRTKSTITIATPTLIRELLGTAKNVSSRTRLLFVSDVNLQEYGEVIKELMGRGNVRFKQYPLKDYWAIIRDREEVLFGPDVPEDAFVAVLSEHDSIVQIFEQFINAQIVGRSKEILL